MTIENVFATFDYETFNQAQLVGVFDSGSSEWSGARSSGIGGSEIGTICGLNPWESAFALWAKRTGQIPDPELTGWSVRFGKAFEGPILQLWAEEHPEYELFIPGTYRHSVDTFMLANCDALAKHRETGEWIVVEVKTSRGSWFEVPPHYVAQVQHYMYVMGIARAVVVGVVGWDWKEHWVEYDEFQALSQRDAAERFWDAMQKMIKPDWDGSKATYEAVRYLHPEIEDEKVNLSDLGWELLDAVEQVSAAEEALNEVKSKVLDFMGKAKYGYVMNYKGEEQVVAQRSARGDNAPFLVVKGKK